MNLPNALIQQVLWTPGSSIIILQFVSIQIRSYMYRTDTTHSRTLGSSIILQFVSIKYRMNMNIERI